MPAYILNIQTALRPPKNLKSVANQISQQLGNLSIGLNPAAIKQLAQAQVNINGIGSSVKRTANEFKILGKAAAETFQRFAGFTIILTQVYALIGAVKSATSEAIDFEKELLKIKQVSGGSTGQIKTLADETTRLSTSLGVSSKELLKATQVFAQAGLSVKETTKAMEALALSDVSPTFENMTDTAEGLVAVMAQFKVPATEFKNVLESIDAVSAKFAVESEDLITAVRRTGGAFEAAGGSLNELLALFTSVRATTRESAESIATGLRTIFARLQRPRTKTFLETLGIDTFDNNQFKGPLEAIKNISQALAKISKQDIRFASIVEELGGIRQLSKVIPLIKEFEKAQEALIIAETAQGRLSENARIAQEGLANQLVKTKEEFLALFRTIIGDKSFKELASGALSIASAFAQISKNLQGIIPLLVSAGTLISAIQIGQFAGGFGQKLGLTSGKKGNLTLGGGIAGGGLAAGLGLGALAGLSQKFNLLGDSTNKVVEALSSFALQLASTQFLLSSVAQQRLEGKRSQLKIDSGNLLATNELIPQVTRQRDILSRNRDRQNKRADRLAALAQTTGTNIQNITTANIQRGQDITKLQANAAPQNAINALTPYISTLQGRLRPQRRNSRGQLLPFSPTQTKIRQDLAFANQQLTQAQQAEQSRVDTISNLHQSISSSRVVQGNLINTQGKLKRGEDLARFRAESSDEGKLAGDARLKELEERKSIVQKRIDATNRQIRQTEILTATISVATSAVELFSHFLLSGGRGQLQNGNAGGKRNFVAGSALSSAATFGAAGAIIGTQINPGVGTAVGAGVGAISGGAFGLITGAKEAERILENVRFEKAIEELDQKFKDISFGRASGLFQSGDVTSRLNGIRQSLKEAGPEDKAERLQNIANLTTGLTDFLSKTAQASATFEQFNTSTYEAIQFLSDFTHVPVAKLQSDFAGLINATNKLATTEDVFVTLQERNFERLNEINNFVSAISDATDHLEKFDSNIENIASIASGGVGSTFLQNSADILRKGPSSLNGVGFSRAVSSVTSPFGTAGNKLAGEANSLVGVSKILPSVLLRLSKKDPFGQGSDFVDNLEDELKGLPDVIRQSIVNQAEQIIGAEEKDQKIISEIQHNVVEVSQKLLSGFKDITEPLADIADNLFKASQSVLKQAQARARAEEAATGFTLKSLDIEQQRQDFIAKFNNTHVPFGTSSGIDNARQSAILGRDSGLAGNISGIFGAIGATRSSITGKEAELSLATEITTRHRLIDEIESERDRLGRLNKAVDFLADGMSRAAPAIAEFERLRGLRETRKDFFDEALFGDKETRRGLRGGFLGVSELKRTGGDIGAVPDSFKGATLGLLTRFLKDRVFSGSTGEEILSATRAKSGSLVGIPGGAEASAAAEAEKKLSEAKAIEEKRAFDAAKDARDISVSIQTNTADTVKNLEILIKQGQATQLLNTQSKLIAEKQGLSGPIGLRNRASELTGGIDLNLVRNNLGGIKQLRDIGARQQQAGAARNLLALAPGQLQSTTLLAQKLKGVQTKDTRLLDSTITNTGVQQTLDILSKEVGPEFADSFRIAMEKNLKFDSSNNVIRSGLGTTGASEFGALLESELGKLARSGVTDANEFNKKRGEIGANLGVDPTLFFDSIKELEEIFNILPKDISELDKKSKDASNSLKNVNDALNALGLTGDEFKGAGISFSDNINKLTSTLEKNPIPSEISMNVNHKVEVILNGGEVLAALGPQLSNLAVASATKEINRMIRDKFPDVGELA